MRKHVGAFYSGCLAAELDAVKLEFESLRRAAGGDPALPRFAGQAVAAGRLLARLQGTWDVVQVSRGAMDGWMAARPFLARKC